MSGASRKTKLSRYEVTLKREIEHTAVVEVNARSAEEAKEIAENSVDDMKPSPWREGDLMASSTTAKRMGDAVSPLAKREASDDPIGLHSMVEGNRSGRQT